MKARQVLVLAMVSLLVACGGESNSDSGGGSAASTSPDPAETRVASSCLALVDEGQTLKAGAPVDGNKNFRISNNCSYAVKARLYSGGYVGTTVSSLAPGASAVDDFFVLPGEPRGFACKAPYQPEVSLAGGLTRNCV